jgi:hypothetical protein
MLEIDSGQLNQTGAEGAAVTFYRTDDLYKFVVSLAGMGMMFQLLITRINIARIGTSGLEHLFGVTRLGTRGNNHPDAIRKRIAKSYVSARLSDKAGLPIVKRSHMNVAGTICDLCKPGLFGLDGFFSPDVGKVFVDNVISWLRPNGGGRMDRGLDWVLMEFAQLFGLAKDGQRPMKVTGLGGHAIEARLRFVSHLEAVTKKFCWGCQKTRVLALKWHGGASDQELMDHFRIDDATLQKGKKKVLENIRKMEATFVSLGEEIHGVPIEFVALL